MAAKKKAPEGGRLIYVPNDSASVPGESPGDPDIQLIKWETRVREGHWLIARYPHLFELIHVHFDVEAATAEPGAAR